MDQSLPSIKKKKMNHFPSWLNFVLILLVVGCSQKTETIEYVYDGRRNISIIKNENIASRYKSDEIKTIKFKLEPNSEYCIELFKNGLKKREGQIVNNQKEGLWKYYYSNGNPGSHIRYRNGKVNGRVFEIDSLGGVRFVGNQNMGKLEGFSTYFFEDGTIRKQGEHKNGKQVGEWIRNE